MKDGVKRQGKTSFGEYFREAVLVPRNYEYGMHIKTSETVMLV